MKSVSPVVDNFLRAVHRERPERIPVASCISSQYICDLYGVGVKEYLFNSRKKLEIQCAFQDHWPELMIVPGIYPDFGCGVVEPSAFGCQLEQRENNPLSPKPLCPKLLQAKSLQEQDGAKSIEALARLKAPDPKKDGLLPRVLDEYRYFWGCIDRRYIEFYGYLDGFAFAMGPVETAAIMMGYENFLIGLHDSPGLIHRILNMTTDFTIRWLKAQESVNGTLKRVYFFDHTPARVGPAHFEEFVFPYISAVLEEVSQAIRIYHICEKNISHVLPRLGKLGIDVLYSAVDLTEVKKTLGEKVCLMGNLSPIGLLRGGTPDQIRMQCRLLINSVSVPEGGFILAPSGAYIPGTPEENIRAVIDST
jgi:uroporphyrinogen decarboxylase